MTNLTKITLLLQFFLSLYFQSFANAQFVNKHWGKDAFISPNGKKIDVSFAVGLKEKTKGLSGLDESKMKDNEGLFFYYNTMGPMAFWMPNTHFNLDIIFLDKNLRIVAVEENVKHFKESGPPEAVPTTKEYFAQYVLELKAGQAKKYGIWPGKYIKWENKDKYIKRFSK